MIDVIVTNGEIDEKEKSAYINYGKKQYPHREITSIEVTLDDEFVDLAYHFKSAPPFQRIRRITGYLVGTTDRWNDAKKAEERDRVKHSMC